MSTSKHRGHDIYYDDNTGWRYVEDGSLVSQNWLTKGCKHCGKSDTGKGHDGCLGTLKGVGNACCGHGFSDEAYVQFLDGSSVHGEDASIILNILKNHKDVEEAPLFKHYSELKAENKNMSDMLKLILDWHKNPKNDFLLNPAEKCMIEEVLRGEDYE